MEEGARKYMKKKTIKYKNEPINAKVIDDFLPSPEELIFKEETIKVTLTLTKKNLAFFKKIAK